MYPGAPVEREPINDFAAVKDDDNAKGDDDHDAGGDLAEGELSNKQSQLTEKLYGSDVDLDASYSDDDDQIYFDKKEFIEHLSEIEEDNLFKINLLQSDEEQLEILKKSS